MTITTTTSAIATSYPTPPLAQVMATTTIISPRANSLAIERMREKDEKERLEKICTKQKRGTPIVSGATKKRN